MKIVITGHTTGLGKSLYDFLVDQGHTVVGLSRSNGFDLSHNLDMFLLENWDVFINNAYYEFKQTELLYKLFELNKERNCTIVNICSVSADGNYDRVNQYAIHKSSLDKACFQLQLIDSNCKVVCVKLGRMQTPMVAHIKNMPKMNTQWIAQYLVYNVIYVPDQILIKNITIDLMHSRRPLDYNQTE